MGLGRVVDMMAAEPSEPLVRILAVASPGTFEDLYVEEYDPMVRLATVMLADRELAADVVHDSFAKVFERWERLDRPGAYLRTAVVNGCRDRRRRARVRRRTALPRPDDAELGADHMLGLLDQLPGPRRDALVLRFYLGLSEADIAETLGVRPGTVKSMVSRGLAQLAEMIGADDRDDPAGRPRAPSTEGGAT